jgi:hypothetical protein
MNISFRSLVLSSATVLGAAAAFQASAGTVSVSFVNATAFTDAGSPPWEAQASLRSLEAHLKALGARHLPAEQSLNVEVLDVDLAGHAVPSRAAGRDIRVVGSAVDMPRITLRYTLQSPGQPALSGEEALADLNYTRNLPGDRGTDALHFEKRLLETWFKARLVDRR